jgi:hypothetical protein
MTTLTALPPLNVNGRGLDYLERDEGGDSEDENSGGESAVKKRSNPGLSGLIQSKQFTISNLLLKKINFTKAKSTFALEEIPYQPVNHQKTPPLSRTIPPVTLISTQLVPSPTTATPPSSVTPSSSSRNPALYPAVDPGVAWQQQTRIGKGLRNTGNTCFLNSALQVLLHTAPLIKNLSNGTHHNQATCKSTKRLPLESFR